MYLFYSFVIFPWYGEGERAAATATCKPGTHPLFEGDPRGLLGAPPQEMGFPHSNAGRVPSCFTDEHGHPTTKPLSTGAILQSLAPPTWERCWGIRPGVEDTNLRDRGALPSRTRRGQHGNAFSFQIRRALCRGQHNSASSWWSKPSPHTPTICTPPSRLENWFTGKAGYGMHVTCPLMKDGKCVFMTIPRAGAKRRHPRTFCAGCARWTNPLVNSYKRLVSG